MLFVVATMSDVTLDQAMQFVMDDGIPVLQMPPPSMDAML
jgi:hypothetical protein